MDAGEGTQWAAELPLRDAILDKLEEIRKVPTVQVVVQGGPGTLQTIKEAVTRSETPVILLAESGGAATAIADHLVRRASDTDSVRPKRESWLATLAASRRFASVLSPLLHQPRQTEHSPGAA